MKIRFLTILTLALIPVCIVAKQQHYTNLIAALSDVDTKPAYSDLSSQVSDLGPEIMPIKQHHDVFASLADKSDAFYKENKDVLSNKANSALRKLHNNAKSRASTSNLTLRNLDTHRKQSESHIKKYNDFIKTAIPETNADVNDALKQVLASDMPEKRQKPEPVQKPKKQTTNKKKSKKNKQSKQEQMFDEELDQAPMKKSKSKKMSRKEQVNA